jgi:hypothetical protein
VVRGKLRIAAALFVFVAALYLPAAAAATTKRLAPQVAKVRLEAVAWTANGQTTRRLYLHLYRRRSHSPWPAERTRVDWRCLGHGYRGRAHRVDRMTLIASAPLDQAGWQRAVAAGQSTRVRIAARDWEPFTRTASLALSSSFAE